MTGPRVAMRFACDADFTVAHLIARLNSSGALHGPVESRADELYLDTRTDELAAAGLSLRCREHAGVRILEIVVVPIDPAVPPRSGRLERAVPRGAQLGEAARQWVAERFGLALDEAPREVLSLVIARRRWAHLDNGVSVEVVLDEIGATEPHGRSARLAELAIDADQGAPDDDRGALQLARLLDRVPGLTAARRSTFERARAGLGLGELRYGSKPAPLATDDLLVDGARRVLAAWWATAGAHVPGVRVGLDPEHVHKLRVALRRLRTAMRLFEDAFDPTALTALRARVRTLGRALGQVRDLDVQREALGGWRQRFPTVDVGAWQEIESRMDRMAVAARREAIALLEGPALLAVEAEIGRCVAPDVRGLRHTIGAVAPGLVRKGAARCVRALERARKGGADEAHALRIEVKNLRYSLDFLGEALPRTQGIATRLAALQEELGRVQDDVQTGELALRLAGMAPSPTSAAAYALGVLVGYGRARGDHARAAATEAVAAHHFEEALLRLQALDSADPRG